MTEPKTKIVVEGVYKIFGSTTKNALAMARDNVSKAEILAKTGCILALNNIKLEIGAGETFVIMGLSGSGKSTLIRHFNRLVEPTAGSIRIDGEDVLAMDKRRLLAFRRGGVSMVFQRFGLLPHQTVLENVICGLTLRGVDHATAIKQGREQIEIVGLSGFENKFPRQLSGGMQQRVGLARALATEADILLMDEAFSALDPLIKADMQTQLKDIQKRLKKTIIFITHDLDEGLHLGDRLAILKDGEVRQVGTGQDIVFNPADNYVQRFVRKVDYSRALTVRSVLERNPAGPDTLGIVHPDGASEAANGAQGSVDIDASLASCFPMLAQSQALIVTEGGRPVGSIGRIATFRAMAKSSSQYR